MNKITWHITQKTHLEQSRTVSWPQRSTKNEKRMETCIYKNHCPIHIRSQSNCLTICQPFDPFPLLKWIVSVCFWLHSIKNCVVLGFCIIKFQFKVWTTEWENGYYVGNCFISRLNDMNIIYMNNFWMDIWWWNEQLSNKIPPFRNWYFWNAAQLMHFDGIFGGWKGSSRILLILN